MKKFHKDLSLWKISLSIVSNETIYLFLYIYYKTSIYTSEKINKEIYRVLLINK